MYTLEQLLQKTFKQLKEIGWELNLLPAGDRRCRQYWIDAITGVKPPLLEVSPGVEVEPVAEAIEVQPQDAPIESKFGRIVYPKPAAEPIAQVSENSPGVSFDVEEFQQTHATEIESYVASFNDEQPPNRGGGDRGRLENEPRLSQSAIALSDKNPPGVDHKTSTAHQLLERLKSWVHVIDCPTLSDSFQARYSPPQSHNIHYQADVSGQLNVFDFEIESADEPPDPDDFDSLDAFREALARWDAENPEPPAVSMDSMSEWAPCPDDWYEPTAENLPLEAPSMEVMELSPVIETIEIIEIIEIIESSSTCEFLIPVFGLGDRTNDTDEPPDTGIFARLPKPKPPSFPPRGVVAGLRVFLQKLGIDPVAHRLTFDKRFLLQEASIVEIEATKDCFAREF